MRSNTTTAPNRGGSTAASEAAPALLPRLILPAIFVLTALAVLISLGNWQLRRLQWKEALIANAAERPSGAVRELPPATAWQSFDVAQAEYRPFRLTGRFLHDDEALVFTSLSNPNGAYSGPGYWVVTPFELQSGGTVLVNRGFAPQGRHRAPDRGEKRSSEPTTVNGLLRPNEDPNFLTPEDRPDENIFFARNIAALADAKGLPAPIAPFTIDLLASATPPGGLPQAGETRMLFTNNHLAYAVTWYGLAAALLAVFASFVWSRLQEGRKAPRLTQPSQHP